MTVLIILLVLFVLLGGYLMFLYNKMVANKNRMLDAWSGIDVFLKKRHDLIPNLVETVKGYATHEKTTFEQITQYRSEAMQAKSPQDKAESESMLGKALTNLFAVAENYPELKANENFQQLQKQLADLENELESSRRYYNGTVRENNTFMEQFPANMLVGMFSFQKGEFFNISSDEKGVPKVSF